LHVFSQIKSKFHYVQPTFQVNSEKLHGLRRRKPSDSPETSTNWSGGVVFAPAGQSFYWVFADWIIPNVAAPKQNQWFYCSSWVGIDGDGSNDVCQAGIEGDVFQSGTSITHVFYPWWEWFGGPEVRITNLAVSPGDMVTVGICTGQLGVVVSPEGAGATTARVFFTNRTSGAATSFDISAPAGTKLVGNCIEWIVEAPTVNGVQSQIADYGQVFFTHCLAKTTDANAAPVTVDTGDSINMTADGSVVSQGTLVSSTVVECEYVAAAGT
jgi:hypothetical protein